MQDPADLAAALGRNVRTLRQRRRLSIDALAGAAGVSRGTVIQIEAGRANPGIATLVHLAESLGVGVASLVDAGTGPRLTVRRRDRTAALWTSDAGSRAVFLMGTDPPDVVEQWDWVLEPGDDFAGEAHPPGTLELIYVLDGTLEVTLGAASETVAAGDTVLFEAREPHRYAHSGGPDAPATRFVMTILQPGDTGIGPPAGIAEAR